MRKAAGRNSAGNCQDPFAVLSGILQQTGKKFLVAMNQPNLPGPHHSAGELPCNSPALAQKSRPQH